MGPDVDATQMTKIDLKAAGRRVLLRNRQCNYQTTLRKSAMREIKFSYIWKHCDTGDLKETFISLNSFEERIGKGVYHLNKHRLLARRQFTGRKDRLKRDIYEGDRIKKDSGVFNVIWNHRVAGFMLIKPSSSNSGIRFPHQSSELEVCGHIYEDPTGMALKHQGLFELMFNEYNLSLTDDELKQIKRTVLQDNK